MAPRLAGLPFGPVIAWLALVLAFVLPAVLSWQRWTDPLVDVGRQPYVAWRILEGDRLYLDIAHVFGPLAAHVQAAVMALSGVSLASLAGFHLFLIACFALQLRGFFGWLGGACAGLGAAMSFLLLCAFPQYIFQANYNFVTPYSADLVYGLMLAMLCLSLVLRCGAGTAAPWRWVAAGACLGLVVLGKPEVCVALLAALLVAMLRAPQGARNILLLWGSALATLLLAFLAFLPTQGAAGALHAVFAAFAPIGSMGASGEAFYRWVSGFDAPWQHLQRAVAEFGVVLFFVAAGVGLERLARGSRHAALALATVLLVSLPAVLLYPPVQVAVVQQGLAFLPLALLAVMVVVLRARQPHTPRPQADAWLVLAVFALAMLLKILLAARLFHYGFALAMPAVVLLFAWLLAGCRREDAAWWWRRMPLFALVLGLTLAHLNTSREHYALRTLDLQAAGDRLRVFRDGKDVRGPLVQAFLDWQKTAILPQATVLVLPDAAMLNFLSRHAAGTRYYALPAPELAFHGEQAVLASLAAAPPDVVVLVDQSSALLGRFGEPGYGAEILGWVGANYTPLVLFGEEPLAGKGFGIGVLAHKTRTGAAVALQR